MILDNVGNHPTSRLREALTPNGILVLNAGGSPGRILGALVPMVGAMVLDRFVQQHLRPLPTKFDRQELLDVIELIEDGKLTPVVDRTYALADTVAGLRYVEEGHARGKVVITVA